MLHPIPLIEATIIRRRKHFLADVIVVGKTITVLCLNMDSTAVLLDKGDGWQEGFLDREER